VLVCDDHELTRTALGMILDGAPGLRLVGEAADGMQAVLAAERLRPDVVIMDVHMPRLDGIEATRRIMSSPAPAAILVLTVFGTDENVFEALRAGALGFLLKDAPAEELVDAVHIVADGGSVVAPRLLRRLLDTFSGRAPGPPAARDPRLALLTPREQEVLVLVGAAKSNREIARDLRVSEATIKTHVSRTLSKLDVRSRAQALIVARETGLA